jgi:hypothetical protein
MRRVTVRENADAGQDSFLDVVTNIVGILIILVMVIGARVHTLSLSSEASASPAVAVSLEELASLAQQATSVEHELAELESQLVTLVAAANDAGMGRMQLATAVAALEVERDARRASVDEDTALAAKHRARMEELKAAIAEADAEAKALAYDEAETEEVLAYPTPIGRTVNGDEMHFQLAGGHIAYIPLEELFGMARNRAQRHTGSLTQLTNHIESVGPSNGFSLDYVIETQVDRARGQILVRSREWVVRPQHQALGETVEVALAQGSAFRRKLSRLTPATTVTLWCYPDSFEAFREVRAELYRLGIAAAGRPLPEGAPIGGSADGSKSVAQ